MINQSLISCTMLNSHMQHYKSLSEFCLLNRIQILPAPHATWRLLVIPCVGEINGLGRTFRGLAVATNGIIVAIETGTGLIIFGHLQYFIKDKDESVSDLDESIDKFDNRKRIEKQISRMQTLFEECF